MFWFFHCFAFKLGANLTGSCVTQVTQEEVLPSMVSSTCCSCDINSNGAEPENQLCEFCHSFVPRKRLKTLVDDLSDLEAVTCIGNICDVEPQWHHVDDCLSHGYLLPLRLTNY